MKATGHWYLIRLDSPVLEPPIEQERMLHVISDAMTARAAAAADERRAGHVVPERPAHIHADRKAGVIVWYLDDGVRALYRLAGGVREPEAHFDGLPATEGPMRVLNGRSYVVEECDAGQASRD